MKTCPKIVSYEDATVLSLGFDLDARKRGEGGGKEEGGNTTTTSVYFFNAWQIRFPDKFKRAQSGSPPPLLRTLDEGPPSHTRTDTALVPGRIGNAAAEGEM